MGVAITVNGGPVTIDLDGAATLSAVINRVVQVCMKPGELVMEVTLNGVPLELGEATVTPDIPVAQIASLDIATIADPSAKLVELIHRVEEYVGGLSARLPEVADTFRMGSSEEANGQLVLVLEGVASFTQLMDSARLLSRVDLSDLASEGQSLDSLESEAVELLRDLQTSQEKHDWVAVADLLEYELAPLLAKWIGVLPKVREELQKSQN